MLDILFRRRASEPVSQASAPKTAVVEELMPEPAESAELATPAEPAELVTPALHEVQHVFSGGDGRPDTRAQIEHA